MSEVTWLLLIGGLLVLLVAAVVVLRPILSRRALEREAGAVRPETLLRTLGHQRPILLAVDDSGSMVTFRHTQEVWMKAFREAGAQVITFDHEVHVDQRPLRNGGGTDFERVRTYVEEMETHPVVVMLTDGMAYQFSVDRPDLWHWALVHEPHMPDFTDRLPGTTHNVQEVR